MGSIPLAVQLFTVRELLRQDYPGTLQAIKQLGYDHVQLSAVLPETGAQAWHLLREAGLTTVGVHLSLARLRADLEAAIQYCQAAGTRDLVCPWLPEEERRTPEDWLRLAHELDELGSRCHAAGMRLSYHHHSFEFVRVGDQYALEVLLQESHPECLRAEFDTYWLWHGAQHPCAWLERYADRCPLLHVKDFGTEGAFESIGQGCLNWSAIHAAALQAGVEYYIVEQDVCPDDPLKCLQRSREFLLQLQ